ncbi:MAG: hypothetical protein ACYYKD_08165 [Rhodospirillales bacterium]
MAVTLSNYVFEGLFTKVGGLENASGVYAIFTRSASGGDWDIVDVAASPDVRASVESGKRQDCWDRNNKGALGYAAYYCKEGTRARVADEVRRDYGPPCSCRRACVGKGGHDAGLQGVRHDRFKTDRAH